MNIDLASTFEAELAENKVYEWAFALLIILVVVAGLAMAKLLLRRRLDRYREGDQVTWQRLLLELLDRTSLAFILLVGLYAGALLLVLPEAAVRFIRAAFIVGLFVQAALWADRVVEAVMNWRLSRRQDGGVRNALSLINFLGRVAVWSLALLLILSNLGFDVTALVAGLGIGGVAIALAAQNILSDLFASLSIVLDRPFEVGDFIIFGDGDLGTVEKIGIKTTRIRALSGEQLVAANADLLNSRIRNFKRMQQRRVVFSVGVTYETPEDKLEAIPAMLKEIVEGTDHVRFDRAHFLAFGDFALTFEIVYWVLSADFNVYADVQQQMNLAIFRRFKAEGIDFAYPTQTLYLPGVEAGMERRLAAADGAGRS